MIARSVSERIWRQIDPADRRELADVCNRLPRSFSPFAHKLLNQYEKKAARLHTNEASEYAKSLKTGVLADLFADVDLPFQAEESGIADAANRAVKRTADILRRLSSQDEAIAALVRLARRYAVMMPNKPAEGIFKRMTDPCWWRRALRRRFQKVEHAAIRAGLVNSRAAAYVSDEAMLRNQQHARRTAKLLESLEAINETTGETIALSKIAKRSLANPENRRTFTMVRIRGVEEYALSQGLEGHFLTWTCPSRMHAALKKSGEPNPRYDGTSPRKANQYLCKLWNSAKRKLARDGVGFLGIRVVEPHHDATPHWHLLVFVRPDQAEATLATLRAYALMDSPDEPGAKEARFTAERIDPAKGSAVGYVAKYVSKNIDGFGVGQDDEAGKSAEVTAPRAVVWARTWNIRQFQFFGCGPITPYQELYRLNAISQDMEPALGAAFRAVKENDHGAYLKALKTSGTRLSNARDDKESVRYPGEFIKRVCGVQVNGAETLTTRFDIWTIRPKSKPEAVEISAPWTRFNNSAPIDLMGVFKTNKGEKNDGDDMQNHPNRIRAGAVQVEPIERLLQANIDALRRLGNAAAAEAIEHECRVLDTCMVWAGTGGQKKQSPQPRTATN